RAGAIRPNTSQVSALTTWRGSNPIPERLDALRDRIGNVFLGDDPYDLGRPPVAGGPRYNRQGRPMACHPIDNIENHVVLSRQREISPHDVAELYAGM